MKHIKAASSVVFFFAFFCSIGIVQASTVVCTALSPFNGSANDASGAIQACINAAAANNIVELPAGKYYVARQIKVENKPITLRTQGKNISMPRCKFNVVGDCAEIKAMDNFNDANGILFFGENTTGSSIDHIVVDGNKQGRTASNSYAYAQGCGSGNNRYGMNIWFQSPNCSLSNSISKNALCGTAVQLFGDLGNMKINNNLIAFNGNHAPRKEWVADGLTVMVARNSEFINNEFYDNTDVSLILGGCVNCKVQNNKIRHSGIAKGMSQTGLMLYKWAGFGGDYSNTIISGNVIDCSADRQGCGVGLQIGSVDGVGGQVFGGKVMGNTISNVPQGVLISEAHDMEVRDNKVTGAGNDILVWTTDNKIIDVATNSYNMSGATSNINIEGDIYNANYTHWNWPAKIGVVNHDCKPDRCVISENIAQYVSQSVPERMVAGQDYSVSVTMKNVGSSSWISAENYKLGSQNPQDNKIWGLHRVNLGSEITVEPVDSDTKTFNFIVIAPVIPGIYNFQWQMLKEDVEWFGGKTPNVAVTVTAALVCNPQTVSGCKVCKSDGSGWTDDDSKCAAGQHCDKGECKIAAPGAKTYNATFAELARYHSACNSSVPYSNVCNAAIDRYCRAKGYESGFGAVEYYGSDLLDLVCAPKAEAKIFTALAGDLTKYQTDCNTGYPVSSACNFAIHNYCQAKGYESGFGATGHFGNTLWLACVSNKLAKTISVTLAELTAKHSNCNSAAPFSLACNSAIHKYCRAKGYESGFGPIENNGGNDLRLTCVLNNIIKQICVPGSVSGCKVCKSDGSGWTDDDSKCVANQICQNGVCSILCASKTCATLGNYQCGNWSDGCGKTINCGTCAANKTCSVGKCVTNCTAHSTKKCDSGKLYWYNSCNTKEGLYQDCGIDQPTSVYRCNGSWRQRETIKKICANNACASESVWANDTDCAASGKTCRNGVCQTNCTNECTANAKQCDGTAGFKTCATTNGCLKWGATTNCPTGQTCSGAGVCATTCTPTCTTANAKQCSGNGIQTCTLSGGCLKWGVAVSCGTGKTCNAGVCKTTCAPKTCATLGNYQCGNWSDGCGKTITCGTCASGKTCSNGKCVTNCTAHSTKKCESGKLYWYNSCNAKEGLAQDCGTDQLTANYRCRGNWTQRETIKKGCANDACTSESIWNNEVDCNTIGKVCISGVCHASCTSKTCSSLGYFCGTAGDGCGNTLNCGTCGSNQACQSGTCVPQSSGGDGSSGGSGGSGGSSGGAATTKMTREQIIAKINEIVALIAKLQEQLKAITGKTAYSCNQITKNLYYGMKNDPQVKCLQELLQSQGYALTISGNYDLATKNAVKMFQEKYAREILTPYGLRAGSGNVGNATVKILNALIGANQ